MRVVTTLSGVITPTRAASTAARGSWVGRRVLPAAHPGRNEELRLYIELARDLSTRLGRMSRLPALGTKEH